MPLCRQFSALLLLGSFAALGFAQGPARSPKSGNTAKSLQNLGVQTLRFDPATLDGIDVAMQDSTFSRFILELKEPSGDISQLQAINENAQARAALGVLASDVAFKSLLMRKERYIFIRTMAPDPIQFGGLSEGGLKSLRSISESAIALNTAIPVNLPDEYLGTLGGYATLVDMARQDRLSKRERILDDIAADLGVKARFAQSNSADPIGKVSVSVHTKDGTNEEGGYEVFYASSVDADLGKAYKTLKGFSSPAKDELQPGSYVLYCQKDGRKGPARDRSIGDAGAATEFDLPVR